MTVSRPDRAAGFTLIELLIVVVIIGLLAAIAIPQAANVKERSYRGTMRHDLRTLAMAQEAYFSDNQTYAPALADLGQLFRESENVTVALKGVSDSGWEAEASHALSAMTCSIAVDQRRAEAPSCP